MTTSISTSTSTYAYASFFACNANTNDIETIDGVTNPYYVSETDIDSIINKNTTYYDEDNINDNSIPPIVYKIHTPSGAAIEAMDNDDNDSIASSVCSSCYPDSAEEDDIIPLTLVESIVSSPDSSRPNSRVIDCVGVTRKIMYEYLIKYFPKFTETENKQKMVQYLSTQFMCNCTDCGGTDSFGECEIELEHEKHFGVIVQHNEL